MPLSPEQIDLLNSKGPSIIRERLSYAGAGDGATVPGLGDRWMSRGDVEEWLAEKDREAAKLQVDTLRWAKAAFWGTVSIGAIGIIVTVVVAAFGK